MANRHLRLKRLFVPSPLFRIGGGDGFAFAMHGDQSEVFQKIIQHCTCGRRLVAWRDWRWRSPWKFRGRVWLSRAQLTSHHRPAISNEEEIERVFRSHGFQVVCPEKLPFERQVALYHGADIIAGIAGSAMHNSIFMRPGTTALTIHSAREHQQELKGGPVGRIQELCDEVARVRHRVIKFRGTITDPEKPIARFDIRYLKAELPKVLLS